MSKLTALNQELTDIGYLKIVTQALGEIAALRLKMIKEEIQHSSGYYDDVAHVFSSVKQIAQRRKALYKDNTQLFNRLNKNGKTISVLITSNAGLQGGIDNYLTRVFMHQTEKYQSDRLVIGSTGANLLSSSGYRLPFNKLKFQKDSPSHDELMQLVQLINPYEKILIYYTKFESLIRQSAQIRDLTAISETTDPNKPIDYILEPELDRILDFFENQILGLLIQSIFLQEELARLAARMLAMNKAEDNADDLLKDTRRSLIKAKRQIMNNQMLETLAARLKVRQST
jgi:F-type H+-transporting ATPase subunit gamma